RTSAGPTNYSGLQMSAACLEFSLEAVFNGHALCVNSKHRPHPIANSYNHQRLSSRGNDQQMSADQPGNKRVEMTEQRLRALVAEYEARLNEVADLVAHVRHEINNPLTGVLGQAQLLLREELSPTARRRVETIEQLAARIRDIVAQLREVQRPQKQ